MRFGSWVDALIHLPVARCEEQVPAHIQRRWVSHRLSCMPSLKSESVRYRGNPGKTKLWPVSGSRHVVTIHKPIAYLAVETGKVIVTHLTVEDNGDREAGGHGHRSSHAHKFGSPWWNFYLYPPPYGCTSHQIMLQSGHHFPFSCTGCLALSSTVHRGDFVFLYLYLFNQWQFWTDTGIQIENQELCKHC